MAMIRYSTATVVEPVIASDKWANDIYEQACSGDRCRIKTAKTVLAKFDPRRYVLSHSTIIAAVQTDLADSGNPNSDYYIHPMYSKFVNNNGDAWSKPLIKACYRTFIGCNNYCFPAGTRVLMADGTYRPIEFIKEGDKVINRKGEIGSVTQTFVRSSDRLTELSGRGILSRKLMVTPEHPFWLHSARKTCPKTGRPNFFDKDKDFHKLSSWIGFSVGVHKAENETYPVGVTPDWVEAQEVDPERDFFSHPISSTEIENSEINANRAELIGWFLAEGSYQTLNKFTLGEESGVVFNLGNDELDVAERLAGILTAEFGKHFRIDCEPRVYETESGSYCLSVSNKVVADFFKKWCGKYAWAKRLPEEAMLLPKNLQAIILKNCINGDGSGAVASRGYSLEMKSKDLIQQLLFMSWRLRLLPTYRETGVLGRYSVLNMVDGFEVYVDPNTGKKSRPGYLLRFSTRDSKSLNRYLNVLDEKIASRESNRVTNILGNESGQWLLSKINSKRSVDVSCEVYNIEVDNDNSYIAEGVAVHNCEHVQIPELSKGKVIDAVLREIPIGKSASGEELTTYYVDILVATDRKHKDLVRKIEAGELDKMSMGCTISFSLCTRCGNKAVDETQACQHVKYEKNNMFFDENGVQRKTAELCGHHSEPNSVKFCDASWVANPAFIGAVKRNNIYPSADVMSKLEVAFKKKGYQFKEGDFLKAAMLLLAADEPVAPSKKKKEEDADTPVEPDTDVPDETPQEGDMPSDVPEGEGDAPPPPDPGAQPEPPEESGSDIKKFKTMIKQKLLKQLGDEIADEFSKEEEDSTPNELETLDESIIKPASVQNQKVWSLKEDERRAYHKIGSHLAKLLNTGRITKNEFSRLRYGTYMILASKDLPMLADYGYKKRDFLALLSYLDGRTGNPLPICIKRAIADMGGSKGKKPSEILMNVVSSIGRKVTRSEGKRALMWIKLMDEYDS